MDNSKYAYLFFWVLILSACGGGSENSSPSKIVSSISSVNSSSSSSSSQVSYQKKLEIKFSDSGCLESSNADAYTDFDFAGSPRRMLSWGCLSNGENSSVSTSLDLFYAYDSVLACYKKISNDPFLIEGGLFNQVYFPECSSAAKPVAQPTYMLEIVDLKILPLSQAVEPKLGFSLSYELKNVGTLPITQFKIEWKETRYPAGVLLGTTGSYSSDSKLLPGKTILVDDSKFYSSLYSLGDFIEFTFKVTDYYGNELASVIKRVAVE